MSAIRSSESNLQAQTSTTPLIRESKPVEDNGVVAKGKRKIVGLNPKKEGETDAHELERTGAAVSTTSPAPGLLPSPPLTMSPSDRRASPRGSPRMLPVGSPNRRIRSSSPGLHSPASSSIFERNVQEPEPSPAIPAHIKTEDHIPPALDHTAIAITDGHLNPDDVEIVMHPAHQPASAAVAGSMTDSLHSPSLAYEDSMASVHADMTESASNYGSFDMADPRRLSFISFADVVQAEHVEQDRELLSSGEAMQYMSLSSTAANRSPSPVRSPASSPGMSISPPTSGAASPKGAEHGHLRSPGSPMFPTAHGTNSPSLGGEQPLQIETMRQALQKTDAGDLGGFRSQPLSAVSIEDSTADQQPFR